MLICFSVTSRFSMWLFGDGRTRGAVTASVKVHRDEIWRQTAGDLTICTDLATGPCLTLTTRSTLLRSRAWFNARYGAGCMWQWISTPAEETRIGTGHRSFPSLGGIEGRTYDGSLGSSCVDLDNTRPHEDCFPRSSDTVWAGGDCLGHGLERLSSYKPL
jgi:hypothetical protein